MTILAGDTSASIVIAPLPDTLVEGSETVIVTLGSVTGNAGITVDSGNDSDMLNIADDDGALVSIAADSDGAEPSTNGSFTVTMTNPSSSDTKLNYSVGGTAAGSDYTVLSGDVTILAGDTSASIVIAPLPDTLVEGSETVIVTLGSVTGNVGITVDSGNDSDMLNIADDDGALVSIAADSDGAEPSTNGSFTVTMTNPSSSDTKLNYSVGGTAAAGSDYTVLSGDVTILAGDTSASIVIAPLPDTLVEGSETVIVTLGSVTGNAGITVDSGNDSDMLNIADDDGALVSIAADSDGAEPSTNGSFTVTMTNPSSSDTKLNYSVGGNGCGGQRLHGPIRRRDHSGR